MLPRLRVPFIPLDDRMDRLNVNQYSGLLFKLGLVVLGGSVAFGADVPEISPEKVQFFETKIRPIFANHCLECHSSEKGKVKGGFNMDTRDDVLKGGENGVALKPGDVKGSSLIKAVEWVDDLQMPPKKKLGDEQIAALKEWVVMGAPDPRVGAGGPRLTKKDHWSFQPVNRPTPPTVKNAAWCKTSVDKFILAKLEEKQMLPADQPDTGSEDDRRTKKEALLRRAYFDLIGMPPTPQEIREFIQDTSPGAFEKVVDTLLASPGYGERWARHWMDTARYSDTTGAIANNLRGADYRYAYAWAYRDWVIGALNRDLPYDQFILNQLAADKIQDNAKENLAALGFLTVGQRFPNKDDIINDRIDAVGRGFLGLTLGCARCHDHKFDPIKMSDYYALRGVFASCVEPAEGPIVGGDPTSKEYQEFTKKMNALEKKAFETVFQMEQEISEKLRAHAAAYFEAAYLERKKDDPEAKKRAEQVEKEAKFGPREENYIRDHLVRRMDPRDPVFGPFVQLLSKDAPAEGGGGRRMRGGGGGPNPLVTEYLAKAGKLPNDSTTVAVLFQKFVRETIDPAIKGGIYKRIADPKLDVANSPEKPLMELAAFPLRLAAGPDVTTVEGVKRLIGAWGLRDGGALEARSGLSKMNELKISTAGGAVRAMVLEDLPKPVDSPIFPRGNAPKAGEATKVVPRRFIEVLTKGGNPEPFKEGSGRLELAQAIASKENPLTARVMVNRVWMYHFGEGLVRTPDDLGNQAGQASHPELLDFLSSWFMDDYGEKKPAWSLKALHKAIMLSSTYQQSSRTLYLQKQEKMDPSNQLLWRTNIRRLDFESFRDSLLTMSGTMDKTVYGPPVNLVSEPYSFRRSVYGYIDRGNVPDLLMQFDMASPLEPNTKRTSTIVPQQALFLMNSPFTMGVVQHIAKRPELVNAVAVQKDTRAGIMAVFQIVLQRTPSKSEYDMALAFLQKEAKMQGTEVLETSQIAADGMKRAEALLKADQNATGRRAAKKAVTNEGELVQRHALSPWESLVQSLMFCNEAAYLN
ncbi:MAG: PSD1 and planctomycete cytochrome C domain-containing protein [Verrucomicrobiota bacterium]